MKLNVLRLAIGIISLGAGSGCSFVTAKNDPLPLPVRPVLMHWGEGALKCLSEPVAIIVKTNQVKLIKWGETMEAVILTTHTK